MSSNTKIHLLNDLEALRQQLAELEAYHPEDGSAQESVTEAQNDNIPLLGDAVLSEREEAIMARREAVAILDAELKELDENNSLSSSDTVTQQPLSTTQPLDDPSSPAITFDDDLISDDIDIPELITEDNEDPHSPPPHLSSSAQPESLILEIPTVPTEPTQVPAEPSLTESPQALETSPTEVDASPAKLGPVNVEAQRSATETQLSQHKVFSTHEPPLHDNTFNNASLEVDPSILEVDPTTLKASPSASNSKPKPSTHISFEAELTTELKTELKTEPKAAPSRQSIKNDAGPSIAIREYAPHPNTAQTTSTQELPAFLQTDSLMANTPPKTQATLGSMPLQVSPEDNPFLPLHLRERLSKSKNSLLEGIAKSSESLDASTALLRNFGGKAQAEENMQPMTSKVTTAQHQALINHLVAKYLPVIEAELRQQLHASLSPQANHRYSTPETTM
ncbi:hypothetical protein [Marinagarivorans algicola]|uniref:hypothetical protein n=1 Tax=Marinagarivorans algicola TaxID=1513270 RepID=UPI0037370BB0